MTRRQSQLIDSQFNLPRAAAAVLYAMENDLVVPSVIPLHKNQPGSLVNRTFQEVRVAKDRLQRDLTPGLAVKWTHNVDAAAASNQTVSSAEFVQPVGFDIFSFPFWVVTAKVDRTGSSIDSKTWSLGSYNGAGSVFRSNLNLALTLSELEKGAWLLLNGNTLRLRTASGGIAAESQRYFIDDMRVFANPRESFAGQIIPSTSPAQDWAVATASDSLRSEFDTTSAKLTVDIVAMTWKAFTGFSEVEAGPGHRELDLDAFYAATDPDPLAD